MPKTPTQVVSHWNVLIEGLQASPMDFYAAVEQAVEKRSIPESERSRVDWHEGTLLSAKREYLRVKRKEYAVDICGAPFGNGFFVSEWGGEFRRGPLALLIILFSLALVFFSCLKAFGLGVGIVVGVILDPLLVYGLARNAPSEIEGWDDPLIALPGFGPFYQLVFHPPTYYHIDTANMFWTAVHAAVQEVIDGMTKAQGLRALTAEERKPVMREFWQR
jgi:hypothetical protein